MNTVSEVIHEIDEVTMPDAKRRQLLLAATSAKGGVGRSTSPASASGRWLLHKMASGRGGKR